MKPLHDRAFFKFLIIGAAGFVTDAGLLFLLISWGGDPYQMRFASFALAVCVTWYGNRNWTFSSAHRDQHPPSFVTYLGVQGFGMAVNYATYASLLWLMSPTPLHAVYATMLGSIVALVVNYIGSSVLVFQRQNETHQLP
ncbi:MAG: GtrA family protein [Pelagimonas sp.]|jgi:putative flippase GtrA|nr:GtrA family protein [Pelagimonas sp.]